MIVLSIGHENSIRGICRLPPNSSASENILETSKKLWESRKKFGKEKVRGQSHKNPVGVIYMNNKINIKRLDKRRTIHRFSIRRMPYERCRERCPVPCLLLILSLYSTQNRYPLQIRTLQGMESSCPLLKKQLPQKCSSCLLLKM